MREFAVTAVGLAPLAEQRDDLLSLLLQQPVHRRAARPRVVQVAMIAAAKPPVGTQLTEFELGARSAQRPALVSGLIEQLEQSSLGGRVDSAGDLAT